jgi:hypothetical protein
MFHESPLFPEDWAREEFARSRPGTDAQFADAAYMVIGQLGLDLPVWTLNIAKFPPERNGMAAGTRT